MVAVAGFGRGGDQRRGGDRTGEKSYSEHVEASLTLTRTHFAA
jgi:hypothetical protein